LIFLAELPAGLVKLSPYSGEWEVGRIYQTRGGPENVHWFWSRTVNGPMKRSDRVATLEEAKRSFKRIGMLGRRGRSWIKCRKSRFIRTRLTEV
jgi:hypothetical protein